MANSHPYLITIFYFLIIFLVNNFLAVQHERAPRSCMTTQQMPLNGITMEMYSTPRRLPSLTPSGLFLPMPMHIPTIDTSRYFPSFQGGMLDPLQLGNGVFMPPKMNTNYLRSSPGNNSSGKDDEVTSSEETQNTNFTNLRTNFKKEAIFESAAKLLFLAVKWARSVPSFSQLPVRDQTILLEESWAELFVITSAQWGLTIDNEFISNEPGWKNLQRAINKFVGMRIDQTEAACLKALTLFKPDSMGLLSCHQIASLQDQTLSLLSEKCGGVRLGHILLILPVVKTAANPQLLQVKLFKFCFFFSETDFFFFDF